MQSDYFMLNKDQKTKNNPFIVGGRESTAYGVTFELSHRVMEYKCVSEERRKGKRYFRQRKRSVQRHGADKG